MKRPRNHGQIATKGPCQLKSDTSASARTQSEPAPQGAGMGHLCSGEAGRTGLQTDALSKGSHEPRSCLFSCLEEH